jgi:hypothetical protein
VDNSETTIETGDNMWVLPRDYSFRNENFQFSILWGFLHHSSPVASFFHCTFFLLFLLNHDHLWKFRISLFLHPFFLYPIHYFSPKKRNPFREKPSVFISLHHATIFPLTHFMFWFHILSSSSRYSFSRSSRNIS